MAPDEAPGSYFAHVGEIMVMITQLQIRNQPSEINGHIVRNLSGKYGTEKRSSFLRAFIHDKIEVIVNNFIMNGKAGGKAQALVVGTSFDGGRRGGGRGNRLKKGNGSSPQEHQPMNSSHRDQRTR